MLVFPVVVSCLYCDRIHVIYTTALSVPVMIVVHLHVLNACTCTFLCYNNFMNISISSVTNLPDDKDLIKWDPKFALGIPIIDEQHKHLVELCNKLYTEVLDNRLKYENDNNTQWQNALAGTLKECVNYVATHFSNEEKIMKVVGYEHFSEHKNRHDEFTKKVLETAKGFSSMDFSDAIKFCKFLYECILSHIAHEDKLYVKKVLEYKKN